MAEEKQKSFSEELMEAGTDEQVMVLASLGMTLQQIADFTGMKLRDLKEAIADDDNDLSVAYRKGKSMIEVELSNVIRQQAMNGDSTAIGRLMEKIRKQSQSEDL